MRRSAKGLLIIALITLVAAVGYAQPKIGVVNSQEVLEKSVEGKKVLDRLQQKDKDNQNRLAALDDEIRQLQTKLNTQRLTLTDDAMQQLSSDLERKQTDRKRVAEDALREMQELSNRLFQRIQAELLPIIEQIGKEKNLEIILDLARSGAIYFSPAADITSEVIRKYDASKSGK